MDNQFGGQNTPTNFAPAMPPKKRGGMGPLIGIFIIVVLLLVGALYFWGQKLSQQETVAPTEQVEDQAPQSTGDASVDALLTQSSSDELSAIEADLNSTDTANLDAGASEIDDELGNI